MISKEMKTERAARMGKQKKPSVPRGIVVVIPDIQGGYTKWQYRFAALLIKCFATDTQCQDTVSVTY